LRFEAICSVGAPAANCLRISISLSPNWSSTDPCGDRLSIASTCAMSSLIACSPRATAWIALMSAADSLLFVN
jgi:hypothetical protein